MITTVLIHSLLSNLLGTSLFLLALNSQSVFAFDCPGSKTPPLIIKRKRFYDSSTDEYFPIKGIAYYPRPNDGPLSRGNSVDFYTDKYESRWRKDIANMKDLGVNAVRLYAVDPSANHDNFMCALQEAGIYVMLGLLADCEDCAIGAWVGKNAEPPNCYTSTLKNRGQFVIRSFSKYDNLMAFSAGNEVSIFADDGAGGPREANVPCQKKFLRDMREYVSGCTSSKSNAVLPRAVPIGVVNWDGNFQSFDQHIYYNCRTDPDDVFENTEWFALNSYRHCDGSATSPDEIVGWPALWEEFRKSNFPGPVLFGEYGCRERGFPEMDGFETQRTWFQTEALYTQQYSDVFAGGFVFEYSTEKNPTDSDLQWHADRNHDGIPQSEWPYKRFAKKNYGIGYFGPSDCQHDDGSGDGSIPACEYTKYPEWDGLAKALRQANAQNIRDQFPGAIPACPERFGALSSYDWPTDEDDAELKYCLELKEAEDIATDEPTAAPVRTVTDSPTISPSESIVTPSPTLLPTIAVAVSTFAPTILTNQDVTTMSPTLPPPTPSALSPTSKPTMKPTISPTKSPTKSPTALPTISPTSPRTSSPTDSELNASPNLSPTLSPTPSPSLSPSASPSAEITEDQSGRCSSHLKCLAANLTGFCCPTVDGVVLGCCGSIWEEMDQDEAESSATGLVYHHLATVLALTILWACS